MVITVQPNSGFQKIFPEVNSQKLERARPIMIRDSLIARLGSLEAIMSRHHTSSRSTFSKHPPQVIHKGFRLFIRRKVAARVMFRLEHNVRLGAKESAQRFALSLKPRRIHKGKMTNALGDWPVSFGKKDIPTGTFSCCVFKSWASPDPITSK